MTPCSNYFTTKFEKKFLVSVNDSEYNFQKINSWKDFIEKFSYLTPAIQNYCVNVGSGNPAFIIYNLYKYSNLDIEWVKDFLINCKTGETSYIVFMLYKEHKLDIEWVKDFLINCKTGNPSHAVFYLFTDENELDLNWVKIFIENCKIGDPATYGFFLCQLYTYNLKSKWLKKLITNQKVGEPALVAFNALNVQYLNKSWCINFIEKCKVGNPLIAIYLLARYYQYSRKKLNKLSKIVKLVIHLYQHI